MLYYITCNTLLNNPRGIHMARVGVNYFDVAKAAEAIKTQSQEPTVDRVRERLGTGSKSTIAPLLKRWRSDNSDSADVSGLPNDLVEVVKSLHQRVQQMADHRIEQARQEFKASSDELQKELVEDRNTIVQLTARQQDLERQIVRITDEKNLQGKSLEDTRVHLAKIESQRDEAIARVSELKENVAELRQENRDIRDHFEHYQQRAAEDRQQERDQFRAVNQQLQDQVLELRGLFSQAESRASRLLETNTQLKRSIDELEQINTTLKTDINRKAEDMGNLKRDFETALTKDRECQSKKDLLAEQIATLVRQKADADKEVAVLSQAFDASKTELKAAQDKVVFLTDENKVILQEKALIQGQFKQLQDSL